MFEGRHQQMRGQQLQGASQVHTIEPAVYLFLQEGKAPTIDKLLNDSDSEEEVADVEFQVCLQQQHDSGAFANSAVASWLSVYEARCVASASTYPRGL